MVVLVVKFNFRMVIFARLDLVMELLSFCRIKFRLVNLKNV